MPAVLRIAVIGAGLAGTAAARILQGAGCTVTVFEKSRGFGGRCATRRWEDTVVDHGAQYFTVRTPPFRQTLDTLPPGTLATLTAPILDGAGNPLPQEERHYHRGGNSRLARDLADGLEVRTGTTVGSVTATGPGWAVDGEPFDRILSTAPWPQTARLAGLGDVASNYDPCLTLVLRYAAEWPGRTRAAYAIQNREDPVLVWTACENHKPGRIPAGSTVVIAQASPAFSREHLEADPAVWSAPLRAAAATAWGLEGLEPAAGFTHRWRYARQRALPDTSALPPGWFHAGDGVTESRAEAAWISGEATARLLLAGG